jgi:hypothetical protein
MQTLSFTDFYDLIKALLEVGATFSLALVAVCGLQRASKAILHFS